MGSMTAVKNIPSGMNQLFLVTAALRSSCKFSAEMMDNLDLIAHEHKLASTLSGGNKRTPLHSEAGRFNAPGWNSFLQ